MDLETVVKTEDCILQNYDSTSPAAIAFLPKIGTASNCKQIKNAGESPLTNTEDVKGGSSRKEEASPEEKYKCSIPNCSKSFANKRKLNVHAKYEHRENWFKCDLCGSAFAKHFVFKTHLATHFNVQPHPCNMCSKSFKHIEYLRKHEQQIHQITQRATETSRLQKEPRFQSCESAKISVSLEAVPSPSKNVVLCPHSSTEKSSALATIEPDPLEQPQETQSVKKNRRQEESLAEEKYKCPIPNCSKSFSGKWRLEAHLTNKHGQHWLFKCQLCGRMCSKKSDLKRHLVTHSIARLHNCNMCSTSFKCIKGLRSHERIMHHQITSLYMKKRELAKHEPDLLLKQTLPQITMTTTPTSNLQDSTNEIQAELVDLLTTAPKALVLKVNPTNKCDMRSRC